VTLLSRKERTGNNAKRTRIAIVDDHPLVRERLGEIFNREPDLLVCGEAEDRTAALQLIKESFPDLVIIDLSLKDSDGLELIKDIRSRWPKLLLLVVSMHDESLYAERVIRAGAKGYITKQEATRNVMVAVRRVLEGGVYLNDKAANNLIKRMSGGQNDNPHPPELLADRELQVFELTGLGLNIRQIADRLRIGPKTVETYRARIREKMKLKDGTELLQSAISWCRHR
jgi:DNA-binding NarL/FixJ family response regulator